MSKSKVYRTIAQELETPGSTDLDILTVGTLQAVRKLDNADNKALVIEVYSLD